MLKDVLRESGKKLVYPVLNQIDCAVSAVHVIRNARVDGLYGECFVGELEEIASRRGKVSRWDRVTVWLLAMIEANRNLNAASRMAVFRRELD